MSLLRTLAVLCVGAWLGIMAFFSFAVAPLVFRTVDRAVAGQVVATVLPRYYTWGLALCGLALLTFVLLAVLSSQARRRHLVAAALCAVLVGALLAASTVVLPRAEAARRQRDDVAFARAHRQSVQLNSLAMLTGVAVLVVGTLSRTPRRDP